MPEQDKKKNNDIVPFFIMGKVVLTNLCKSEVDFASNPGTMPPSVELGFAFASCWFV